MYIIPIVKVRDKMIRILLAVFIFMSINAQANIGAIERLALGAVLDDRSNFVQIAKNVISMVLLSKIDSPSKADEVLGTTTEPYGFRDPSTEDIELDVQEFVEKILTVSTMVYSIKDEDSWLEKIWLEARELANKFKGEEKTSYEEHLEVAAAVMLNALSDVNIENFLNEYPSLVKKEDSKTRKEKISKLRNIIEKYSGNFKYEKIYEANSEPQGKFYKFLNDFSYYSRDDIRLKLRDYSPGSYARNILSYMSKSSNAKISTNLSVDDESSKEVFDFISSIIGTIKIHDLKIETDKKEILEMAQSLVEKADNSSIETASLKVSGNSNYFFEMLTKNDNLKVLNLDFKSLNAGEYEIGLSGQSLSKLTIHKNMSTNLKISRKNEPDEEYDEKKIYIHNDLVSQEELKEITYDFKKFLFYLQRYYKKYELEYNYKVDFRKYKLADGTTLRESLKDKKVLSMEDRKYLFEALVGDSLGEHLSRSFFPVGTTQDILSIGLYRES